MEYGFKIEIILSLIPNKPDNLAILHHKENFYTISTQLAVWLFIKKDYTWTYKENNFPDFNYYKQFYYQGALGFFLEYNLYFKHTNLSFFKNFSSSLDIPNY